MVSPKRCRPSLLLRWTQNLQPSPIDGEARCVIRDSRREVSQSRIALSTTRSRTQAIKRTRSPPFGLATRNRMRGRAANTLSRISQNWGHSRSLPCGFSLGRGKRNSGFGGAEYVWNFGVNKLRGSVPHCGVPQRGMKREICVKRLAGLLASGFRSKRIFRLSFARATGRGSCGIPATPHCAGPIPVDGP